MKTLTKRTLLVLIEKDPGVLVRIIGLITRRRFKLENLIVTDCEDKKYHQVTIIIKNEQQGSDEAALQLIKQLKKFINIISIRDISFLPTIQRELILVKLKVSPKQREEILTFASLYNFTIVDLTFKTLSFECTGEPAKILAIEKLIKNYEIIEVSKTGTIGLIGESEIKNTMIRVL